MRKLTAAMSTAAVFVPNPKAWRRSFIVAPSFVLTRKIPNKLRKTPTAAMSIGAMTAFSCISPDEAAKAVAPKAAVERIEPQ